MIVGELTPGNDIFIVVTVQNDEGEQQTLDLLLDTGFSGHLALPLTVVHSLGLQQSDWESAMLADGRVTQFPVYEITVLWHDEERLVTALAGEDIALLGVAMLRGSVTTLEFVDSNTVTIEESI
jgi:clan AA aspartic protease